MSFLKRRYFIYIYIFIIKFLYAQKKIIIDYNHKYTRIHISREQVTKKEIYRNYCQIMMRASNFKIRRNDETHYERMTYYQI